MAAQGQAAGGDGGAQGGEAAQGAAGFDAGALQHALAPITEGQDALRQQLGQFGEFLQSEPWRPQEAQQEEPGDNIDLSFLDYQDPAYGEAERQQMQQGLAETIRSQAQAQAQQMISPVQEQMQELRREQAIRDLVSEFPEFQDVEVAQRIAGPNGMAVQYANDIGHPELAVQPQFWRLVHMASRAAEAANAEGQDGAGASAAHLEGGGGAGPAGGQQVDIASQILESRRGNSVLPFQ